MSSTGSSRQNEKPDSEQLKNQILEIVFDEMRVSTKAQLTKIRADIERLQGEQYEYPASIIQAHVDEMDELLTLAKEYNEALNLWITEEEPDLYSTKREVGLYPEFKQKLWEANGKIGTIIQQLQHSKTNLQGLFEWYAKKNRD